MCPEQLEGLADEILGETDTAAPVDALVLADAYGLAVIPTGPYDEGFSGGEVRFNVRAPYREYHEFVVRCVAREGLARKRMHASQSSIAYLARALMLPRLAFRANADFESLLRAHPYASLALIGARKGDVFGARKGRHTPTIERVLAIQFSRG